MLFVIGWFWVPMLRRYRQTSCVLLLLLAVLAELYLLFGTAPACKAARRTMERWSNGDVNPVTLQLESGYGTDMHVRVLDELPVQFQKRDLVFSGAIAACWARSATSTTRCARCNAACTATARSTCS